MGKKGPGEILKNQGVKKKWLWEYFSIQDWWARGKTVLKNQVGTVFFRNSIISVFLLCRTAGWRFCVWWELLWQSLHNSQQHQHGPGGSGRRPPQRERRQPLKMCDVTHRTASHLWRHSEQPPVGKVLMTSHGTTTSGVKFYPLLQNILPHVTSHRTTTSRGKFYRTTSLLWRHIEQTPVRESSTE